MGIPVSGGEDRQQTQSSTWGYLYQRERIIRKHDLQHGDTCIRGRGLSANTIFNMGIPVSGGEDRQQTRSSTWGYLYQGERIVSKHDLQHGDTCIRGKGSSANMIFNMGIPVSEGKDHQQTRSSTWGYLYQGERIVNKHDLQHGDTCIRGIGSSANTIFNMGIPVSEGKDHQQTRSSGLDS